MNGAIQITQNQYGAWLIYIGELLVFSSVSKSRVLEYAETIK